MLPLLDLAKGRVPQQYWASTPLVLKATAGLRLLDSEKADALLDEVSRFIVHDMWLPLVSVFLHSSPVFPVPFFPLKMIVHSDWCCSTLTFRD